VPQQRKKSEILDWLRSNGWREVRPGTWAHDIICTLEWSWFRAVELTDDYLENPTAQQRYRANLVETKKWYELAKQFSKPEALTICGGKYRELVMDMKSQGLDVSQEVYNVAVKESGETNDTSQ